MRVHFGTYYSNSRPHKCRTRNYVSTSAENGPAMAGPAGPVPAPMPIVRQYNTAFHVYKQHLKILFMVLKVIHTYVDSYLSD